MNHAERAGQAPANTGSEASPLAKLKTSRKYRMDNYFAGLLVLLAAPLLPLLAEFWVKGVIGTDSVLLAAAMYVLALGFASEWRSFFVVTVMAAFLLSVGYGTSAAEAATTSV